MAVKFKRKEKNNYAYESFFSRFTIGNFRGLNIPIYEIPLSREKTLLFSFHAAEFNRTFSRVSLTLNSPLTCDLSLFIPLLGNVSCSFKKLCGLTAIHPFYSLYFLLIFQELV